MNSFLLRAFVCRTSCVLALVTASAAGLMNTGAAEAQRDPLTEVAEADPLDLGRVAKRLGDRAVLQRLRNGSPAQQLAAIRATPWMWAPEYALEPLGEHALGRDPHLGPASVQAALQIAQQLRPWDLPRRESSPERLRSASVTLRKLADDRTARQDLRRMAGVTAALLEDLIALEPRPPSSR